MGESAGPASTVLPDIGSGAALDIAALIDAAPVGLCVLDRELRFLYCNATLAEIHGLPAAVRVGSCAREASPELAKALETVFHRILAGELPAAERRFSGEAPRLPGVRRTWMEKIRPLVGKDGAVDGIVVAVHDITALDRAEAQLRLVTREFRHRMKNLLAVVGGLVAQSAKQAPDVPAFSAALLRQLASLSTAQDLLLAEPDEDVLIEAVIASPLEPFKAHGIEVAGGPEVRVAPSCVVPLALALNELATNSIKHGPGPGAGGAIRVGWSVESGRIHLRWAEPDADLADQAGREGFGSQLLDLAARSLPHGALRIDRSAGLLIELTFDASSD